MAIIKIKSSNNMKNLINYIQDEKSHNDNILYSNAIGVDPATAARDMQLCKMAYCKTKGSQGKHLIVALSKQEEAKIVADNNIEKTADKIADIIYSNTGCQVAYAIHGNTDNLHIHYALNSVRIADGYKMQLNYKSKYQLESEVKTFLSRQKN